MRELQPVTADDVAAEGAHASMGATGFPVATTSSLVRYFRELYILIRIEFANVRDSWVWSVLMASMFPLTTLMFFHFFTVDPSPATVARLVTGNMVFPIILMGINALAQELSWAKHQGHFVFYASLPIHKVNFVIAKLTNGFLMTLPSVIIMAVIGQVVFGITFHYTLWILPVLVLAVGSCVGFGTLIGFLSPNHQLTNIISQVFMMVLTFLTPVMIDIHQLPKVLQVLSYVFPTTYAADAFRRLFTTGMTPQTAVDAGVLLGYSILSLLVILWKMDWRAER